ncbi:gypsy/ty3 retroelement polyprotein [Tanacetum coccineum]
MVATRSATDTTDPNSLVTPNPIEEGLQRIQTAIDSMHQSINGLLLFQLIVAPIITRLANGEGTSQRGQSTYDRLTKLEFPKFSGEDVQGWLYRVNQFFLLDSIQEDAQKIMLVSMHLFGNALNWHKQFMKRNNGTVIWQHYEEGIKERFDPINENPMVELKILKQTGSIQAYEDLFEALLNKVDQTEAYAISLFIGGLKDEIGLAVRMFKPNKLTDAYCLAKIQEATLAIPKHRYTPILPTPKNVATSFVPKTGRYEAKGNILALPSTSQTVGLNRPRKQLTQQEMAEKRAKQLCFYCDQRYSPGHKCSGQMYCLEVSGCDELIEHDDCVESEQEHVIVSEVEEEVVPQVSLNAMNGVNSYQTMRIKGHVGKQALHMLVDYGSTHNFLDLQAAKRMGCRMTKTCPLQVSVANGQLATLGKIQCDFKNLVMEFVVNGRKCILRGTSQSALKWMQGMQMSSSLSQIGSEISSMTMCIYPATLMQLSHDHTIPLAPNAPHINIRPYRHPPIQKDAIELMVKELLEAGTIRNIQSSFSSPIVMVKNKDGTWRMCVDYRQLNKYTIKDKFPILVIEELLDELSGAKVTYEGHYEFLVMPFGLTNAPSTFQALVNSVFKPYLRKFVLVFFDDILIYNKIEEEHWKHLHRVLQTMKMNTLFAKLSKCSFVVNKVEYLGHVISEEGVSTDPTKIHAMEQWPIPPNNQATKGIFGIDRML